MEGAGGGGGRLFLSVKASHIDSWLVGSQYPYLSILSAREKQGFLLEPGRRAGTACGRAPLGAARYILGQGETIDHHLSELMLQICTSYM